MKILNILVLLSFIATVWFAFWLTTPVKAVPVGTTETHQIFTIDRDGNGHDSSLACSDVTVSHDADGYTISYTGTAQTKIYETHLLRVDIYPSSATPLDERKMCSQ